MQRWKPFALFEKHQLVTDPSEGSLSRANYPYKSNHKNVPRNNFSSDRKNNGAPPTPHRGIRALEITCCTAGGGSVYFGDAKGKVSVADEETFSLRRFRAHSYRVNHMKYISRMGVLITIGDGTDARDTRTRLQSRVVSESTLREILRGGKSGAAGDPSSPSSSNDGSDNINTYNNNNNNDDDDDNDDNDVERKDSNSGRNGGEGTVDGAADQGGVEGAVLDPNVPTQDPAAPGERARAVAKIWTFSSGEEESGRKREGGRPGQRGRIVRGGEVEEGAEGSDNQDRFSPASLFFMPSCVSEFRIFTHDFPEQPITSMAVLADLTMMAVGLGNGAVLLFRGDLCKVPVGSGRGAAMSGDVGEDVVGWRKARGGGGGGGVCTRFLLQAALPSPCPVTALAFAYPTFSSSSLSLFVGTADQLLCYSKVREILFAMICLILFVSLVDFTFLFFIYYFLCFIFFMVFVSHSSSFFYLYCFFHFRVGLSKVLLLLLLLLSFLPFSLSPSLFLPPLTWDFEWCRSLPVKTKRHDVPNNSVDQDQSPTVSHSGREQTSLMILIHDTWRHGMVIALPFHLSCPSSQPPRDKEEEEEEEEEEKVKEEEEEGRAARRWR